LIEGENELKHITLIMNIEQLKNEIKKQINQIKEFDLTKLYPDNDNVALWNNVTNSEAKKWVESIVNTLKDLTKNIDLLDAVGFKHIQNLNNQLTNFASHFNAIAELETSQITSQHHSPLNDFIKINNTLRTTGLYTELKVQPKLQEKLKSLKENEPLINRLIKESESLTNAIEQANEWLQTKGKIDEKTIQGQAEAFLERANDHKLGGEKIQRRIFKWKISTGRALNPWLTGTLFFAVIVSVFTFDFIKEAGDVANAGQAIIRISSLLVPAYLTVFCANQFLYHKKLREAYMFKFASLHTMNHLMSTKAELMQQKILEKGLGVLFSEPSTKEESRKYDKQIISELIGMLKAQIK